MTLAPERAFERGEEYGSIDRAPAAPLRPAQGFRHCDARDALAGRPYARAAYGGRRAHARRGRLLRDRHRLAEGRRHRSGSASDADVPEPEAVRDAVRPGQRGARPPAARPAVEGSVEGVGPEGPGRPRDVD